jgi:cyclopropane-fatty-acyl-phospholipid synthase
VRRSARPSGALSPAAATELEAAIRARAGTVPISFRLRVDGHCATIGQGEPGFELSIRTPTGMDAVLSLRELAIAEAYLDGDIDIEGDLYGAMALRDVLVDRDAGFLLKGWAKPLLVGRRRCNPAWIAQHYDAGNIQLLATDRRWHTYTPGIYEHDPDSLEDGAERKLAAAFRALRLGPGSTLLDVGCGWGGFVRYCAQRGVAATGITLSTDQLHHGRRMLSEEGLDADVQYADFFAFEPRQAFDAISLMGVLEDLSDYHRVMERLRRWLRPGGRIYCDFAASNTRLGVSSFITKYVWPGRFRLVFLPTFMRAVGAASFEVVELHNDRRNYRLWASKLHDRWVERKDEVLEITDERQWRLFRLLTAGVASTMDDSTARATAYRVVLAPRRTIA